MDGEPAFPRTRVPGGCSRVPTWHLPAGRSHQIRRSTPRRSPSSPTRRNCIPGNPEVARSPSLRAPLLTHGRTSRRYCPWMSSPWPAGELRVNVRRSGREAEPPDPAEQGAISLVGEERGRVVYRHPGKLVDLLGRAEAPSAGPHRPVRDHLVAAPPVPIARTAYEPLQPAAQPGLLRHFTECAFVLFLSGHQFALGEGPVVVRRPVNEGDLNHTLALAPHDPPSTLDELVGGGASEWLCLHAS